MMIRDDMLFHNIREMPYNSEIDGYKLQRLTTEVIENLGNRLNPARNEFIRNRYKRPSGAEIRMVLEDDAVFVNLYTNAIGTTVTVLYGENIQQHIKLAQGYNCIKLKNPDRMKYLDITTKIGRFTPNVARLCFFCAGDSDAYYVSKSGKTRLPNAEELPTKKIMAYGTSITQGSTASSQVMTFIHQTAKNIGYDVYNLGIGGGAYCEDAIAEFVSEDTSWDIATLCISVNMLTAGYELEDYYETIRKLVRKIHYTHPEKDIFCISPYLYFGDLKEFEDTTTNTAHPNEYREKLRMVVEEINSPHLHYVCGTDLLNELDLLTTDLIHPSDFGMTKIANGLTEIIKSKI